MKRLPLWPSHAGRWVNCPGSPRVTSASLDFPRDSSPDAEKGTLAHAILASILSGEPATDYLDGELKSRYEDMDVEEWLPGDEFTIVEQAAEDIHFFAGIGGFKIHVEIVLNLNFPDHETHCRVDILLEAADRVCIVDYKHGAGIAVHVDTSAQMQLYALAAAATYPGKAISIGILQPRGMGDGLQLHKLNKEDLEILLKMFTAAVKKAYALGGTTYNPGPWCRFCAGYRGLCPELLKRVLDVMAGFNAGQAYDHDAPFPPWELLHVVDDVKKWLTGLDKQAFTNLANDVPVPGWGLTIEPGRRGWHDATEAAPVLAELLGGDQSDYENTTTKPIGIVEASKRAKKAKVDITSLIKRPDRRVMIPMTDRGNVGFSSVIEGRNDEKRG